EQVLREVRTEGVERLRRAVDRGVVQALGNDDGLVERQAVRLHVVADVAACVGGDGDVGRRGERTIRERDREIGSRNGKRSAAHTDGRRDGTHLIYVRRRPLYRVNGNAVGVRLEANDTNDLPQ